MNLKLEYETLAPNIALRLLLQAFSSDSLYFRRLALGTGPESLNLVLRARLTVGEGQAKPISSRSREILAVESKHPAPHSGLAHRRSTDLYISHSPFTARVPSPSSAS